MSQKLHKYAAALNQLRRFTNKQKQKWLKKNSNKEFVHCICECAQNILNGKVPLSTKQKKELRRQKTGLRNLVKRSLSIKKKQKILQKGGFLGAILGPIVSVLGGLLGSTFRR